MKLSLHNQELWEKFRELQNEMVVTNRGRRMYPVISISFKDLNPRHYYTVMVDFVSVDDYKYKFDAKSSRWFPSSMKASSWSKHKKFDEGSSAIYTHPETPATGASLMKSVLHFTKLKLTNSDHLTSKNSQVVFLNTMHRYIPRVHVVGSVGGIHFDWKTKQEFSLPEAEFTAVTQYRNKQIAQLKIDANPFASAFRSEGLHGKAKRRRTDESNAADGKAEASEDITQRSSRSSLEECQYTSGNELGLQPRSVENCSSDGRLVRSYSHSSSQTQTGPQQELTCAPSTTTASRPQCSGKRTFVTQSPDNGILSRRSVIVVYCGEIVPKDAPTATSRGSNMEPCASEHVIIPQCNRRKRYFPRRVRRTGLTTEDR